MTKIFTMTYKEVLEHLNRVLVTAQEKRNDNKWEFVEIASHHNDLPTKVPSWNLYELKEMLISVNLIRVNNFLEPVTLKDIQRAEQTALGHYDYTKKFALACRDLVFKD